MDENTTIAIVFVAMVLGIISVFIIPYYLAYKSDKLQLEKIKEWNKRKELELKEKE